MNKNDIISSLEDKDIPIEKVEEIFEENRSDPHIVGLVAMNLSLRTSVYDREKNKSPVMTRLLEKLSSVEDMGSRWAVAKNPHTPVEVLRKLAKDEVNLVRALAATNPNTPSDLLAEFFSDEKIVRDGLSGNPSTPNKYLHALADDKDKMVRLRVAENPSAPKETLQKLSKDDDADVSKAADLKLKERT